MKTPRSIYPLFFLLLTWSAAAGAATFTVNSPGDEVDPYLKDGICDIKGNPTASPPVPYGGNCTLRAAIQSANEDADRDEITVSNTMLIQPASQLPGIKHPITLVGPFTLDGSQLPSGMNAGLAVYGEGETYIVEVVISHFSGWGVQLADTGGENIIDGCEIRENGTGIYIASSSTLNTISGNQIVLNTGHGIWLSSTYNTIKDNDIGTDGEKDLGNGGNGIYVNGSLNTLGGSAQVATASAGCWQSEGCNLISGNAGSGIRITAGNSMNSVKGNFIGTDAKGNVKIPNDLHGIWSSGEHVDIIGNLISGNGSPANAQSGHGIALSNGNDNQILGNFIGSTVDGVTPLGNLGSGVNINASYQNTVGNETSQLSYYLSPGSNVILDNGTGISITNVGDPGGNLIAGNFIGMIPDGSGQHQGNAGDGISINGRNTTVIANAIVGNGSVGVEIVGFAVPLGDQPSDGNLVQGNFISANAIAGVTIDHSADNTIGGSESGQGNEIVENGWLGGTGVMVMDSTGLVPAIGNRILGNSIVDNIADTGSSVGIDLGFDGVTPNDDGDGDQGANGLQNFPVITGINGTVVNGILASTPNTSFLVELFASSSCSKSGYGEGESPLGAVNVTTSADGLAQFQTDLPDLAQMPDFPVTATATDPEGSTSEFSLCYSGTTTTTAVTTTTTTAVTTTTTIPGQGGETLNLQFSTGWNLKSSTIPVPASTFGDTSKFTSVWKWPSGKWEVYLPGESPAGAYATSKGFGNLSSINSGEGFWVNSQGDASVSLSGTPVYGSLSFTAGWNLVGLKSSITSTVADITSTKSGIISIWKWQNGNWAVNLPGETTPGAYATSKGFGNLTTINPGEGFWVNVSQ